MDNRRHEPPEVVFTFSSGGSKITPEEIEEILAKRNKILLEMGMLPPDENHEFWWEPEKRRLTRFATALR